MRVRASGTPTHIFHKRKHFIFHLPFLPSRSLRQKVREKVQQKRNYLGRFSKNVGDLSKNVGVFLRYLRRDLYPTYSPKRVYLSPSPQGTTAVAGNGSPSKLGLFAASENHFCAAELAHL